MAFKTPSEVAATAVGMGVAKSRASSGALVVLGFLAGSFIAISAVLSHTISYSLGPWAGPSVVRIVSGLPFSLGIAMVIVGGGELFTGNSLMVMALIDKRIPFRALIRNWIVVYFANMAGAIFVAWLYYRAGLWESVDGTCAESLMAIAVRKSSLDFWPAFFRGVLCNWLVCMGVWMSYSADDVIGRLVPSAMAASAFVMCGAENSVANMFYIPAAFMVSSAPAAECFASLVRNLLPVTFGNVVGGGMLVGAMYWWAYVRSVSEARGTAAR